VTGFDGLTTGRAVVGSDVDHRGQSGAGLAVHRDRDQIVVILAALDLMLVRRRAGTVSRNDNNPA
jgi:hypothetical protein